MKWMTIAFLLILAVAIGLRVPKLADRPMHHDEANQAYRFGTLLEDGTYHYDADDHHGPTLYYLTLPIAWLTGAETFAETNEHTYRLVPVLFGMLLIFFTPLIRSGIGSSAVLAASLLTAISPAMAYYSRFYIQEISLVFFTFVMIASGWHAVRTGSRWWAMVCGISAGLMFATKETAIISYAAIFGSAILCALLSRNTRFPLKNMLVAAAFAVAVSFVLFSSFFTNLDGPLESILAFKGYFARGTGIDTDHVHPFNYYLKMLTFYRFDGGPVWSEGLILGLGLVGCLFIAMRNIPASCDLGLARFIMFYTLLLTLAYSTIAYKTPWCMLSFLHGWILLAGIAVASILDSCRSMAATRNRFVALYSGIALLFAYPVYATYRLADRTVYRFAADYRNPYVYAHTSPDFMNLVTRISELEDVSPKGKTLYIQVIADPDETWPLPFYLRDFPNVGFWVNAELLPSKPKPDIIISAPSSGMDSERYLSEFYALRPDSLLAIHINTNLWNTFIETRK